MHPDSIAIIKSPLGASFQFYLRYALRRGRDSGVEGAYTLSILSEICATAIKIYVDPEEAGLSILSEICNTDTLDHEEAG